MDNTVAQKKSGNTHLIIIGVAIVVLVGIGFIMMSGSKKTAQQTPTKKLDNTELIPTVDASVKVDIKPTNGSKELIISVKSMPNGTETVDYELSYQTEAQGLQGIIGTVTPKEDASSFTEVEKKVTLGTCSSGTCVYHKITGPIKVSLKFGGSYGERLYEKDYTL